MGTSLSFFILASAVTLVDGAVAQTIGSPVINTIAGSGLRGDGGPATSAQLLLPANVAIDATGNLYIADTAIVRLVTPDGKITTFAGTGVAGYRGDGGPAKTAWLGSTITVTVDSSGKVYIADQDNNRVRVVTPDGTITTVAGTGAAGSSGDGGPAASALLSSPSKVAIDAAGNLFISNSSPSFSLSSFNSNRVAKVTAGVISTVAGPVVSIDARTFIGLVPSGITLDAAGSLYIADRSNNIILKLMPGPGGWSSPTQPTATSTIVAGNRTPGTATLPSSLTSQLLYPNDVAVASNGDIYIADLGNHAIKKATQSTAFAVVAGGSNVEGFGGDGKAATSALLNFPRGVSLDTLGNLYIADQYNRRIRKVTPDGIINTVAGATMSLSEPAPAAQLAHPTGAAVANGVVYFADSYNNVVRRLTPDGTLTTIAGTGNANFGGDGGPATQADLARPLGVALDAAGNVFVADTLNHRVRRITPNGTINTVAGTGSHPTGYPSSFGGDGGAATAAVLNTPAGVGVDRAGNLYISDTSNARIRKVTPDGIINTIAGTGMAGFSGDGGPATGAQINYPAGIAVDASGNVYFADNDNNSVRKITPAGVISTVAGTGAKTFSGDGGQAVAAGVSSPTGVALDSAGNLYIADDSRIRKVNPAGVISTIAGNGSTDFAGDGGPATQGQFSPFGVAVDTDNSVYISDYANNRIRSIQTAQTGASGVLNAYSLLPGAIAPGELLTITGSGIGPSGAVVAQADASELIEASLGGAQVFFDGVAAPVISADATQLQVVAPYELAGKTSTVMQIVYQGQRINPVILPVAMTAPGIQTQTSNGIGPAQITNSDGSLNAPGNRAMVGSTVVLIATGEGQTDPPGVDGQISSGAPPMPVWPVSVNVGGVPANLVAYGTVAGAVAGTFQVSFTVPDGAGIGDSAPVVLTVGSASSQPGVTMSIQAAQ